MGIKIKFGKKHINKMKEEELIQRLDEKNKWIKEILKKQEVILQMKIGFFRQKDNTKYSN